MEVFDIYKSSREVTVIDCVGRIDLNGFLIATDGIIIAFLFEKIVSLLLPVFCRHFFHYKKALQSGQTWCCIRQVFAIMDNQVRNVEPKGGTTLVGSKFYFYTRNGGVNITPGMLKISLFNEFAYSVPSSEKYHTVLSTTVGVCSNPLFWKQKERSKALSNWKS